LIVFLGRTGTVSVGPLVRSTGLYALKLTAFSTLAAFPIWRFRDAIRAPFAELGRIPANVLPLAINLAVFGAIGLACLAASRDPILTAVVSRIRGKSSN